MRRVLYRVIEAAAGVVYEWGVSLFRLADWVQGREEEPDVELHMWPGDSTSFNTTATRTWIWTSNRSC